MRRTTVGTNLQDIGKLVFLYDANTLSGADGSEVLTLNDFGPSKATMTGTAGTAPLLYNNRDGFGNNALVFNGTDEFMTSPDNEAIDAKFSTNQWTAFYVQKVTADTGSNQTTWAKYTVGTAQRGPVVGPVRIGANDTSDRIYSDRASGGLALAQNGANNTFNSKRISVMTFPGTVNCEFYYNGITDGTETVSSGTGIFAGNTSTCCLGALEDGTGNFLAGDLYLVGVFEGVLSTASRKKLLNRLAARF